MEDDIPFNFDQEIEDQYVASTDEELFYDDYSEGRSSGIEAESYDP